MNYIILAISMIACLVGSVVKKRSGDKFESKAVMYHVYNAVVSLVSAVSLAAISDGFEISFFTLALGVLFGVITAIQSIFCLKAYEKGPFSYTSVIVSLSTIIPALSGYLIWNEDISAVQIVGILLMMVCFLLSVDFSEKNKKTSVLWFIYVFIAFFTTGFIGVMQKWHQNSAYKGQLDVFLIIAFAVSFLYSFVSALIIGRNSSKKILEKEATVIAVILMIIGGICAAANNKMNLYLSGVMDSAMFFPVVNGGGLILSTLASLIIFKERFNMQKWIGIAIGIVAVVLLCNPF